jgi:hypothetical protein
MGMYDKLGDMLSDYLETGRMPPPRKQPDDSPGESVTARRVEHPAPKEKKIPEYLVGDFYELGFVNLSVTPKLSQVKKKYRALMKSLHPDMSGGVPATSEIAGKKRITALVDAFRRISAWYGAVENTNNAAG